MIGIVGHKRECPMFGHWAKVLIVAASPVYY